MSKSKDQLAKDAARLRDKIAEAEAVLSGYRAKLAKIEAVLTNQPAPETGLDMLWKAALPISRTRSSKMLCRKAWHAIPIHERPKIADAVAALHAWNRCPEWRKDSNQFAIALDRWIRERRWEDLPESAARESRYIAPKPVAPVIPDEEKATPQDASEILAFLRGPRRMNS